MQLRRAIGLSVGSETFTHPRKRPAGRDRFSCLELLELRRLMSSTIWTNATVPTIPAFDDSSSVELGVRFRSDQAGVINGVKFYKGAGNTGTHLASLWTAAGTLLGQATFTSESASGWQEADFASPIAIAANTTYIASYFAPNGHYAVDQGYFAASGTDSAPLHALQDGVDGANGLFAYSPGSSFPTFSANSNNYWVDVVYDTAPVGVAPSVSATSPTNNAKGVASTASVNITFNGAMDASTITSSTVQLRNASNAAIAATLTYDASTRTATLRPTTSMALGGSYTIYVKGGAAGVKSQGGGAMAADFSSAFQVAATAPMSVWNNSTTPAIPSVDDTNSIELGVRFKSDVAGVITGIRFYKGAGNTGTHIGNLWTADGMLLASATFTGESDSGWQEVTFATPIAITANTVYIASYFAPNGHYSADTGYFAAHGADNGTLHALKDGVAGGNGLFGYAATSGFPTLSFNSNNYWVDPVFAVPAPVVVPVTNTAPTAASQNVTVTEDGSATVVLAANDAQTVTSQLKFKITSLPARGILKLNGVAVTIGQAIVGSPANLTYEPGAEQEAGASDAFQFQAIDPQGLVSNTATVAITLSKAVADKSVTLTNGVLRIGGTAGNDIITISQLGGKFIVLFGLSIVSSNVPVASVSEIRVWGRAGTDVITFLGVSNNSFISGGAGTDIITTGAGNDVIMGGLGDDLITADGGDDVLVGGDGNDALFGMTGNDILVAGSTGAASLADLRAMSAKWTLNKTVSTADAAAADNMISDGKADLLTGGGGSDWFIVNVGDIILDKQNTTGNKDIVTYVS